MPSTYSKHAVICARFYDLTVDQETAGALLLKNSGARPGDDVLFIGSMFALAKHLVDLGVNLTLADYSDAMVALGRQRLPGVRVERADLRTLPYAGQFDLVIAIGRVFTHIIGDDDLDRALAACRTALRARGRLLVDNYEDSKIRQTSYFNGVLQVADETSEIVRQSATALVSERPFVVRWDAAYRGVHDGQRFEFSDSMPQRAWSRDEIRRFLSRAGFTTLDQGDNFDETSFFTLAQAL